MELIAFPKLTAHNDAYSQHSDPGRHQSHITHKGPARLRVDIFPSCSAERVIRFHAMDNSAPLKTLFVTNQCYLWVSYEEINIRR